LADLWTASHNYDISDIEMEASALTMHQHLTVKCKTGNQLGIMKLMDFRSNKRGGNVYV
jgi:hypothetical protein